MIVLKNIKNISIICIQNIDTNFGILEASFEAKLTNIRNDLLQLLKNTGYLSDQLYPICYDARQLHTWPLGSVEFDEFRYDADVREGLKNKEIIINPVFEITYDNGKVRSLRTEKGVGFFRQSFDFKKFPFDKQKLLIRINSGVSNLQDSNQNHNEAGQVTFITPEAGPFLDLKKFINPDTNKLKAWNIKNDGIKISSKELISPEYNIWSGKIYNKSTNVLDIEIEINRNYEHYLFKIILPVFLILCVAWYVLWIPTEKYEARLNTSMIALLALIAYNFVFQDDIPKLEYLTDLDWFILLSYIFCCIPVFLSIGFSKFLVKNQKLVILINKRIRSFGLLIYFIITLQIFYGI